MKYKSIEAASPNAMLSAFNQDIRTEGSPAPIAPNRKCPDERRVSLSRRRHTHCTRGALLSLVDSGVQVHYDVDASDNDLS